MRYTAPAGCQRYLAGSDVSVVNFKTPRFQQSEATDFYPQIQSPIGGIAEILNSLWIKAAHGRHAVFFPRPLTSQQEKFSRDLFQK